jgi:toxin ParE1/3/4
VAYRVELTVRAVRDLDRLYDRIEVEDSARAARWFDGLDAAILSLGDQPLRCSATPEDKGLRHLLYGEKPHVYRVIFKVDGRRRVVAVLHIRHGAREPMKAD